MTRTLRFPEPAAWLLPWAFVWALVPSVRAAAPVRLENGVSVASEPSDAPLEVVVTLPAGRRSDPPGKAGLAELTARCLTGSSGAGRPEGDLVALLARTVGGADLGVSDDGITIHLSDVHDLGPALRLVVELVARPELAPAAVLAARSGMAIEAEDALQHDLRASEARARLVGGPSPWEATWELLQLEQEDVAEFHALRYAPGEALVVIAGKGAPAAGAAAETLPEDVRTALEAWPPKPSRSSPDADAAGRVASRAVRNDEPTWILGESSGAAFAHVVVRHAAAALRTAFALDPRNAWELREAPGEQGGRVLVADSRAANPSRALDRKSVV